jgi:hypothetical protein
MRSVPKFGETFEIVEKHRNFKYTGEIYHFFVLQFRNSHSQIFSQSFLSGPHWPSLEPMIPLNAPGLAGAAVNNGRTGGLFLVRNSWIFVVLAQFLLAFQTAPVLGVDVERTVGISHGILRDWDIHIQVVNPYRNPCSVLFEIFAFPIRQQHSSKNCKIPIKFH